MDNMEIMEPVNSPQQSINEVYRGSVAVAYRAQKIFSRRRGALRSCVAAKRPRELCEAKPVALPDSLLVVSALGLSTSSARIPDTLTLSVFAVLRPKRRKASSWRLHGLVIGLKHDGDIRVNGDIGTC